jgi:hypothetical protein
VIQVPESFKGRMECINVEPGLQGKVVEPGLDFQLLQLDKPAPSGKELNELQQNSA